MEVMAALKSCKKNKSILSGDMPVCVSILKAIFYFEDESMVSGRYVCLEKRAKGNLVDGKRSVSIQY